jgi:hypothetical protein
MFMQIMTACLVLFGSLLTQGSHSSEREVSIVRHTNADSITNSEAKTILAWMSQMIEASSECKIPPFVLKGEIRQISAGTGVIRTQNNYNYWNSQPENIKIVLMIQFCDGAPIADATVLGCAGDNRSRMSFIAVKRNRNNHKIWLHEFGHNCGLAHVDNIMKVMNSGISMDSMHPEYNTQVDIGECENYVKGPIGTGPAGKASTAKENQAVIDEQPQQKQMKLEEFVRTAWIDGIPYDQALSYKSDQDAVKTLITMLENSKEEEHWPNVIATLCYIGDNTLVERLSAFFREGDGKLSPDAYRAKNAVLIHFGDILGRTKSNAALNFLQESVSERGIWAYRQKWTGPRGRLENDNDEVLTHSALLGLAVSGDPRALEKLENIRRNKEIVEATKEVIGDLVELNKRVAKIGGIDKYRKEVARKHVNNHQDRGNILKD